MTAANRTLGNEIDRITVNQLSRRAIIYTANAQNEPSLIEIVFHKKYREALDTLDDELPVSDLFYARLTHQNCIFTFTYLGNDVIFKFVIY